MIALESRSIALNTTIAFGIITSFINHAITSEIAKWSDRTMMLVGIYIDVHVIESMHLPSYFLTDHIFPEGNLNLKLYPNPYLSSNWESDLYYYIYYPYICYYFLSLSILSFIISKLLERILISKQYQYTTHYQEKTNSYYYLPFQKSTSLLTLILSCHITSHLLLTITHILIFYHNNLIYN